MKNTLITGLTLATIITSGAANAYDLNDTYIGGNDPRDVIGGLADYDTLGLNATISGTLLTIDIHSNFAGKAEYGYSTYQTQTAASGFGNGIGYGDLFISSGTNTSPWEYGLSIDDRWSATGGAANLFALSGTGADYLLSDDFISTGDYRHGEAVAVDTSSASVTNIGYGNWTIDEANQIISFSVDIANTNLDPANGISLGWGMTCANDLIQGSVEATDIPEPGALGLVGLGLLGTIIGRRRRNKKSA